MLKVVITFVAFIFEPENRLLERFFGQLRLFKTVHALLVSEFRKNILKKCCKPLVIT